MAVALIYVIGGVQHYYNLHGYICSQKDVTIILLYKSLIRSEAKYDIACVQYATINVSHKSNSCSISVHTELLHPGREVWICSWLPQHYGSSRSTKARNSRRAQDLLPVQHGPSNCWWPRHVSRTSTTCYMYSSHVKVPTVSNSNSLKLMNLYVMINFAIHLSHKCNV